jgi:hypothetical protein
MYGRLTDNSNESAYEYRIGEDANPAFHQVTYFGGNHPFKGIGESNEVIMNNIFNLSTEVGSVNIHGSFLSVGVTITVPIK